jgi:hypothetical protein
MLRQTNTSSLMPVEGSCIVAPAVCAAEKHVSIPANAGRSNSEMMSTKIIIKIVTHFTWQEQAKILKKLVTDPFLQVTSYATRVVEVSFVYGVQGRL